MKKIMSKDDYELFEIIVKSSQNKLHKMLYKILKRHYSSIINTKDYLIARGDIPVALVAHMDTVFKLPPGEIYYDREKNVLWSPDGLGADDRAGVFLILKILQTVSCRKKPTIIFTTDEEYGGIGASKIVEDMPKCPWKLKYIIQLDRRGEKDCVFYDDANEEFNDYVEKFGFKSNWGSFSDISFICPAWKVSGVNLSVGYEDEHQEIETLHATHTYKTLDRVLEMLKDINNCSYFKYKEIDTSQTFWYRNYLKYPYSWEDDEEDWFKTAGLKTDEAYCAHCHNKIKKEVTIKAKDDFGLFHYYCGDCAPSYVEWCENCGQPFEIPKNNPYAQTLCADCVDAMWDKTGREVNNE